MSSIRYPESLSNTNRGDRWCLKTRAMYRMKNEGNYTFVFSQISKLKLRKIVSPINNNKQIQYTLHVLPRSTFISCPREPPPFPPNCPSPTIESIRVRCYKKKSARHFRFYAASDVITRTRTHLSRMIFFFSSARDPSIALSTPGCQQIGEYTVE